MNRPANITQPVRIRNEMPLSFLIEEISEVPKGNFDEFIDLLTTIVNHSDFGKEKPWFLFSIITREQKTEINKKGFKIPTELMDRVQAALVSNVGDPKLSL